MEIVVYTIDYTYTIKGVHESFKATVAIKGMPNTKYGEASYFANQTAAFEKFMEIADIMGLDTNNIVTWVIKEKVDDQN